MKLANIITPEAEPTTTLQAWLLRRSLAGLEAERIAALSALWSVDSGLQTELLEPWVQRWVEEAPEHAPALRDLAGLPQPSESDASLILTNSAAATFRACPRKYRFRYVDHRVPRTTASELQFGTQAHTALELIMTSKGLDAALAAIRLPDEYDLHKLRAMIVGYYELWRSGEAETLEVLEVEGVFSFDAGGVNYRGKRDAVVRRADGRVWLMEHKTTSSDIAPGTMYWEQIRLDPQVSLYMRALAEAGTPATGCLYDVLRKPGLRPKRGESARDYGARCLEDIGANPERYYARQDVLRLDTELDETMADMAATAEDIRGCADRGHFPRNPRACFEYFRACSYHGVCTKTADLDDDTRFESREPHEELAT